MKYNLVPKKNVKKSLDPLKSLMFGENGLLDTGKKSYICIKSLILFNPN